MAKSKNRRGRGGPPQFATQRAAFQQRLPAPTVSAPAVSDIPDDARALVDAALSAVDEGVPDLPAVPEDLTPAASPDGAMEPTPEVDDGTDSTEEAPPEQTAEQKLREALELIKPLLTEIRNAHPVATSWLNVAPEIERRRRELDALEDAARENFTARLEAELAKAASEVRQRHEAELAKVRDELEAERDRTRTLNDDLTAQLSKAVVREAEAVRAANEADAARELSVFGAESQVEFQRRQDAASIGRLESELADANASVERYAERVQQLQANLETHQRLLLPLANQDPRELIAELADLRAGAAQSPGLTGLTAEERKELNQLRKDAKSVRKDLDVAHQELLGAKQRAEAQEQKVATLSFQAAAKDTYERMVASQRSELDDLRARIGELRERDGSPFPRCQELAQQHATTRTRRSARRRGTIDLKSIAPALQRRLANDVKKPLRYRLEDLQVAFAGLNASQLHLLEGPSGTGKTSLPIAVSKALGWGCSIVAVQDGWNDRQDLLGYFNTFDQQFQESDFLKALYRAGAPEFVDRPYIIVLDEANLSYVERYFADFLSRLELDPVERDPLSLAPPNLTGAPPRLESGSLDVPTNVWFVGTANQDATTKEFAPKTVDRAHIIRLVRTATTRIAPGSQDVPDDLGVERLTDLFAAAENEHPDSGAAALKRLEDAIAAPLEKLELPLGNRLERYANGFFPVLLAMGGSKALGMDHLLATKVLYPLRTRATSNDEPLKSLAELLSDLWKQEGFNESTSSASRLVAQARNRS